MRKVLRRIRGVALVATLLLASVVLCTALVIAGVGSSHLLMAQKICAERAALYEADGVIRLAAANIAATATYAPTLLTYPTSSPIPDQCAQLTFVPGTQDLDGGADLPYCTNNLDGQHSQGYNGQAVANGTVQVIAVGHCGSVTRTVQAILKVPPFPYVIAGDGTASLPSLSVKGAPNMAAFAAGQAVAQPADIGINGALTLNSATISGDVFYGGALNLIGNVTVAGRFVNSPIQVPQIDTVSDLESHIPVGAAKTPPATDASGNLSLDDLNVYHAPAGLTISGNLQLGNSELFVDGPLNVGGGITGLGGVFVNGSVNVGGVSSVDAANNVAIIAEGDVTLSPGGGGGAGSNFFQGLVYCRGGTIHTSNITVVGALVNAQGGGSCAINLDPSTSVVYVPDVLNVNLQTAPQDAWWVANYDGDFGLGTSLGPQYNDHFVLEHDMVPYSVQTNDGGYKTDGDGHGPEEDAALNTLMAAELTWQNTQAPPAFSLLMSWQPGIKYMPPCRYTIPGLDGGATLMVSSLHFNGLTNRMEMSQPPQVILFKGDDPGGAPIPFSDFDRFAHTQGTSGDDLVGAVVQAETAFMNISNQGISALNATPTTPPPPYPIHISLNNFLGTGNPIQIVSWTSY